MMEIQFTNECIDIILYVLLWFRHMLWVDLMFKMSDLAGCGNHEYVTEIFLCFLWESRICGPIFLPLNIFKMLLRHWNLDYLFNYVHLDTDMKHNSNRLSTYLLPEFMCSVTNNSEDISRWIKSNPHLFSKKN